MLSRRRSRKTGDRQHVIRIGRYVVDSEGLQSIAHRFDAVACTRVGCCCSRYEVSLSKKEADRVRDYVSLAAGYATHLKEETGFTCPIDEEERPRTLETDEEGRCLFAYNDQQGHVLCSLHSAALDLEENPYHVKPMSCSLWPLALSEGRPLMLSVMPDAFDFPCNQPRTVRNGKLDPGVEEIILGVFGPAFLKALERAIAVP